MYSRNILKKELVNQSTIISKQKMGNNYSLNNEMLTKHNCTAKIIYTLLIKNWDVTNPEYRACTPSSLEILSIAWIIPLYFTSLNFASETCP